MIVAQGKCSRFFGNAVWDLDDTGRLTISGDGATDTFSHNTGTPWIEYCKLIKSVVIKRGITKIKDDLCGLTEVESLELADTVTHISGRFKECRKLSKIMVSDNLVYIDDRALEDTAWYRSQPDGMIYLGKVFYKYKGGFSGERIKIKEGTLGIARGAFWDCKALREVDLPDSIISIGHSGHTFRDDCESMSAGDIGWSLEHDGKLFFGGGRGKMKDFTDPEQQPWKAFRKNIRAVIKSSSIEGENIGSNAFAECTELEEVQLDRCVERIGSGAFANCSSLREITGLDNVRLIEKGAFSGCVNLEKIAVPKLIKGLSGQALVRYNEEHDIRFMPEPSLAELSEKGFIVGGYGEDFTWTIDPDGTMNFIGEGRISQNEKYNCYDIALDDKQIRNKVKKLVIDKRITEIGTYAFKEFEKLEEAVLPNGLKVIGHGAFYLCRRLSKVNIPDGVELIGEDAFFRCGLESIDIPESVRFLGNGAFWSCKWLTSVSLPENTMLDAKVFDGTGLEALHEDGVIYLNDWALGGIILPPDSSAKKVLRFRKGTRRIAPQAFGSDDYPVHEEVIGVVLGNDITYLGEEAFSVCENLAEVTADCTFTKIEWGSFRCTKWAANQPLGQLVYLANAVLGTVTRVKGYSQGGLNDEFTDEVIEIDEIHDGREITLIADGAFSRTKTAKKAVIPKYMKYIGSRAFENCIGLETVELPDGLEKVEEFAFCSCNIRKIHIPASVEEIGKYAFGYKANEDRNKHWTSEHYVKTEGFVISGESGSVAERYAAENGFLFIEL